MAKEWPFVQPVASAVFPELQHLLLSIEAYETLGDTERRRRAIIEAVAVALDCGLDAGFRPVTDKDPNYGALDKSVYEGGVAAYIYLPMQAIYKNTTYVFSTSEVAYFLPKGLPYDRHDRTDKLARIQKFVDTDWKNNKDAEGAPTPLPSALKRLPMFP